MGIYQVEHYLGGNYIRQNILDWNNHNGKCPSGSYPGGNFPRWKFFGWELSNGNHPDGNFPGGKFPEQSLLKFIDYEVKPVFKMNKDIN